MEIQEAVTIMRALAGGLDPETSKPLEADSLCRKPAVVKALNRALGALVQLEQRERSRPQNAFRTWTREEDARVCDAVRKGMDFHEIAKAHNRSVGSIVARLVKLGQIAPSSSPTRAA
jgi:DNA-binding NarL/FixJ family response regulator